MLAALSLRYQDFQHDHSYSKVTVSATAALRGGTDFSTFSSECKNWENHTSLQAIILIIRRIKCILTWLEKIRRLKCILIRLEKLRQAIFFRITATRMSL